MKSKNYRMLWIGSLIVSLAAVIQTTAQAQTDILDAESAQETLLKPQAPFAKEGIKKRIGGAIPLLAPTWSEYIMSARGGGGGSFTGHVGGGVIYAVQINAGSYVDHINFAFYKPSAFDNYYRNGDFWGTTGNFGGNGGNASPWTYCPAGKGVIGIQGASGTYVDRVGIICGDVNNPDPFSPNNWVSTIYGGGGGGWFNDTCASGYLVDAFNVRSGSYLDQIQGICVRAH